MQECVKEGLSEKFGSFWLKGKKINFDPKLHAIKNLNFSKPEDKQLFNAILRDQTNQVENSEKTALYHLESAYILKLIENPYESKPIEKYLEIIPLSYPQRLIVEDRCDDDAFTLIRTPSGKNYIDDELLAKAPTTLSQEVFGLTKV